MYSVLVLDLTYQAWRIYDGTPLHYSGKDNTGYQDLVFIVSGVAISFYVIRSVIRFFVALHKSASEG